MPWAYRNIMHFKEKSRTFLEKYNILLGKRSLVLNAFFLNLNIVLIR